MYVWVWFLLNWFGNEAYQKPPLTESEARNATNYLQNCSDILLYDAFDNDFTKKVRFVKIQKVSYQKNKHQYYEIILKGTQMAYFELEGEQMRNYTQLAGQIEEIVQPNEIFVAFRNEDNFYKVHNQLWRARCLAEILEMPYSCCTDDFEYPTK